MPGGEGKPSMYGRVARWGCAALAILLWLPTFVFAAGIVLARLTGCRATQAQAEPCMVAGMDIGHRLYVMTMMGWVVAGLSPLMLLSLVAMAVLLGRHVLRRRSAARPVANDPPRNRL